MEQARQKGMTLIELVVAMAIAGVMIGISVMGFGRWQQNQLLATTARSVAEAFSIARTEAIRTGNIHIVYLSAGVGTDVAGNALLDSNGAPVPLLVLNDGPVGSPGQNCIIDAAEATRTMPIVNGLAWGFTASAGVKAPMDLTTPGNATGSSFATPAGNPHNGIAFGADGVPLAFGLACNLGTFGSGNGGVYLTNGSRDYAVVLQPLGAVRLHGWENVGGAWKN